ncbi:MAG: nucleotidyl transferase AbiEii/AbiGii toxin family protein [Deltaproteobacteria bacterium]|nr:nucleotidyl transferase AbiEii/AbiGii toxin family protein [Deltaproteobacteria bacterium]
MREAFDRRVVPDTVLALLRACQARVAAHLGGGAALSGAHLAHRLSRDVDLVCHRPEDVRALVREFPAISAELGFPITLLRDAGTFVRAQATPGGKVLEVDLIYEAVADLSPPLTLEGVVTESLEDLRAAKLTCLLSRSEPRDLVDLLFLDRAGHPPEADLSLAVQKDAGVDPGVLAWLLGQFPVRPLPLMLVDLDEAEILRFRGELSERFRRIAVPSHGGP